MLFALSSVQLVILYSYAVCVVRGSVVVYFQIGSPTALAVREIETQVLTAASCLGSRTALYIPTGALWGARDIQVSLSLSLGHLTASLPSTFFLFISLEHGRSWAPQSADRDDEKTPQLVQGKPAVPFRSVL